MKRVFLLLIVAAIHYSENGYAQPGYQGRKLAVQGNMHFFPAAVNANYRNEPGLLTLNKTWEATTDYVLGKRSSIGASYRYARTSNLSAYGESGISDEKVFTRYAGIHYRIYRRKPGNIAPLGKYFQLGTGVMFNTVRNTEAISEAVSFRTYAVRLGFGRNQILYDRVLLSYGWEVAHVFTGLSKDGLTGATYYYEDDAQTMAQYRLWRHSLVNVRIGIGFLPF